MEDLEEIDRMLDTYDWQSISAGQQPQRWSDLRKYGFDALWQPFQRAEILIDTFSLDGDKAIFTGRLRSVNMRGDVAFIPLKETWKRTAAGWKRQIHQKFRTGETPQ
jgi:hypothetical protein